jgi:hypothetical protein
MNCVRIQTITSSFQLEHFEFFASQQLRTTFSLVRYVAGESCGSSSIQALTMVSTAS